MVDNQVSCERGLGRHASALRDWAGWYALLRGDNLVGVFPTLTSAARAMGELADPSHATICRIPRPAIPTVDRLLVNRLVNRQIAPSPAKPYVVEPRPLNATDLPNLLAQVTRLNARHRRSTAAAARTMERSTALVVEYAEAVQLCQRTLNQICNCTRPPSTPATAQLPPAAGAHQPPPPSEPPDQPVGLADPAPR